MKRLYLFEFYRMKKPDDTNDRGGAGMDMNVKEEVSFAQLTAMTAAAALLYEVAATPKPGLVDRHNTGSHSDMDITLFQTSAMAIAPYFYRFVCYGMEHCGQGAETLLKESRAIGIDAERAMMKATGGVNTHKGAVFSLGILCMACGWLKGNSNDINSDSLRRISASIAGPVLDDFQGVTKENASSYGQMLYAEYGITGVRGEAAEGFPIVFDTALPVMQDLRSRGYSLNDAGIICLVHIMAALTDTNVIHRSSYEEAEEIRLRMKELIETPLEDQDYVSVLEELDQEFISRNVSPGGCADLLALTYFLYSMQQQPDLIHLPGSMMI